MQEADMQQTRAHVLAVKMQAEFRPVYGIRLTSDKRLAQNLQNVSLV